MSMRIEPESRETKKPVLPQKRKILPSIFNITERTNTIRKHKLEIIKKSQIKSIDINQEIINLKKANISTFYSVVLRVILLFSKLIKHENKNIVALLDSYKEAKKITKYHYKWLKLSKFSKMTSLPFVFSAEKLNLLATKNKYKSIKNIAYLNTLSKLGDLDNTDPLQPHQINYKTIPEKITILLNNILELYSDISKDQKLEFKKNIELLVKKTKELTDASGNTVLQQLANIYNTKAEAYETVSKLYEIKQKIDGNSNLEEIKQEIVELNINAPDLSSMNNNSLSLFIDSKIQNITQEKINKYDQALNDIVKKIDNDLSVYEVSSSRLADTFSSETLKKPINVTMIGVEYSGLVKEGGLAEALEGLTKGMRSQHPDNKVRLIFPKFSILPKNIQDKLSAATPITYKNSEGNPFLVYRIEMDGIEYNFIDDPSFQLSGEKPSIYGPDEIALQNRFAAFSGLAADLVNQLETDVIHLHDWHVAGVALKLIKENPDKWEKNEIPPIVFTYHNNARPAQGRIGQGIYNYDPVIQGLIKAGIASESINAFVEVIKKADAVTTVSETFGIESQDMKTGEGVSFATREAAEIGKLTGIINGSNPHSWNPEKDAALKNWKDVESQEPIDLCYSPDLSDDELLAKKAQAKTQLKKWVSQNFPNIKIDPDKPIVTYIGRFDSYQKGLDKLEEAIEETLKEGGQFIVMGILEDPGATKILDHLQSKYKDKVLIIRDFKAPNGRFHYQQGDESRQGCGSLIRAASDFLFIPSKFEPCGLVQFEGWLFGSLAIGSRVGGLADTIIPPGKNREPFNGFVFDRDSKKENSLKTIMHEALSFWKNSPPNEKASIIRRLIKDGRKYSWTSSPSGYSPVEKYRLVYENAKRFATRRADVASKNIVDISAKVHQVRDKKLLKHAEASDYNKVEENYYKLLNSKKIKLKKLEKAYRKLPQTLRQQVPSPYGLKTDFQTYKQLGAHVRNDGINFFLEAPKAKNVKIKIFNNNNEFSIFSLKKNPQGVWEGFIPDLKEGTKYQYIVNGKAKIDPMGLSHVPNPINGSPPCSVAVNRNYKWNDENWQKTRIQNAGKSSPSSIYEVHPGFWQKENGQYLNYREVADKLVKNCKNMGFTHVELMGILEHPDQRSMGYQVSGFFAPNSRMGSPEDFKYLVDTLHKNNIAVYLDWIPAHFAKDDYALNNFDGSNQYQPSKLSVLFSIRNIAFRWGTKFFNFKKRAVSNFLISSAAYWIKEMHIDGLRVDAVRSILLSENPNASKRFLKDLNRVVHREFPGVMMMAEDYSGAMETTQTISIGGLGFDEKWNIGWMKHTLEYFSQPPQDRPQSYEKIVKAISNDTFHKMILAISHDEMKNGLEMMKMQGMSEEDKFANLRAFFGYIMGVPGKKLMFMGTEFGQQGSIEETLNHPVGTMRDLDENEKNARTCYEYLNKLMINHKPLWENNNNSHDLSWIEKNDPKKLVHAYRRTSNSGESIACLHNFSNTDVKEFTIHLENSETMKQLKTLAENWVNPETNKIVKPIPNQALEQFAFLSRFPHIVKKILSNKKTSDDLFNSLLVNGKTAKEFLNKHGYKELDTKPVEIFNSDDTQFGGKGRKNANIEEIKDINGMITGYKVRIPPLTTIFISEHREKLEST